MRVRQTPKRQHLNVSDRRQVLLGVGCDRRRERLLAADAVTAEPGRAPLVRVRSGASRAEAKGGGAPTGVSAMAAVAGKPIYTPPSLRRKRPNAVPVPCRADSPR